MNHSQTPEQNLLALWRHANEIILLIEEWIRVHDGRDCRLRFKRERREENLARLTRLKVWSMRFGIPIHEILNTIVPPLREMTNYSRAKRPCLGITPATLCGRAAERILQRYIEKTYPDGEQFAERRLLEQECQLDAERREELGGLEPYERHCPSLRDSPSAEQFVANYMREVMRARNELCDAQDAKWRRRKPYRGNPWL